MKKTIVIFLALVCIMNLTACDANDYTCHSLTDGDNLKSNFDPSPLTQPFIEDTKRDHLLTDAIRSYLKDLEAGPLTFTFEITDTHFGTYQNKETILYWVKIVYGEGFTTVVGFIIQENID